MARARNIKPGFFKNEDLGTADPFVSLLFAGLWTLADKSGILEDRPLRIKAELFPYRDGFDIHGYLTVLVSFGLIHRYESAGIRLIQIANFKKHQNPHHTEKDSEYLDYSMCCQESVKQPLINSDAPADSLIPDSLNTDSLIPDSDDQKQPAQKPRLNFFLPEFEEFWNEYPKRPGASRSDSLKAWKARIKESCSPHAMIDGARRYSVYCTTSQTDPKYIKQPSTFLGAGKHFDADWSIEANARASPYKSIHDERRETIEILTGQKNVHTDQRERDITGEAQRVA